MTLASISSLLGFILSVWLLIKSESITKTLKVMSQKKDYNKKSNFFSDRFSGFKSSILEDNDRSSQLFHRILEEIYQVEKEFHTIFSIRDKYTFLLIKYELKRKPPNVEKICFHLDYIIGRLRVKED